jgi:hypothetical protein
MTSPALGTPASGVMTNVTSVPAAQLTGSQAVPKATLPTGSVLQVVQGTLTTPVSTTANNTWVTTGLLASITPTSSSSKILATISGYCYTQNANTQAVFTLYRGATNLSPTIYGFTVVYSASGNVQAGITFSYLDSPATTSATTYTLYMTLTNAAGTVNFNNGNAWGQPTSTIILQEIAA